VKNKLDKLANSFWILEAYSIFLFACAFSLSVFPKPGSQIHITKLLFQMSCYSVMVLFKIKIDCIEIFFFRNGCGHLNCCTLQPSASSVTPSASGKTRCPRTVDEKCLEMSELMASFRPSAPSAVQKCQIARQQPTAAPTLLQPAQFVEYEHPDSHQTEEEQRPAHYTEHEAAKQVC
jgi:hypothetical protein